MILCKELNNIFIMVRNIFSAIFLLLIPFFIFFYWASSSLVSQTDYTGFIKQDSINNQALPDTFSLMTYNIGYLSGMTNNLAVERSEDLFSENMSSLQDLLAQREPNIVLFQEIDFGSNRSFNINQFEKIAKDVGFFHGAYAVNWDKRYVPFPYYPISTHFGKLLSGQAVIAKSVLISNERIVLPRSIENSFFYDAFYLDRLAQKVWLKFGGDSLLLINVHFEAWDVAAREKQARIVIDLFDKYANSYPVILAGDFNCNPPYNQEVIDEKTIRIITEHPLVSSAIKPERYNKSPNSYFTFNSEKPFEKIDYIFYNNKYLQCIDSKVLSLNGTISDHLPMEAVFVRRNPN